MDNLLNEAVFAEKIIVRTIDGSAYEYLKAYISSTKDGEALVIADKDARSHVALFIEKNIVVTEIHGLREVPDETA